MLSNAYTSVEVEWWFNRSREIGLLFDLLGSAYGSWEHYDDDYDDIKAETGQNMGYVSSG